MPNQGPPTEEQLLRGFESVVRHSQLEPSPDGASMRSASGEYELIIAEGAIATLHADIVKTPPPSTNIADPHVLARSVASAAGAVRRMGITAAASTPEVKAEGDRHAQALLTNYAFGLAVSIAQTARHLVAAGDREHRALARLLRANDQGAIEAFMHALLGLGHPRHTPAQRAAVRPRLFVSTPLTAFEHDPDGLRQVMAHAKLVADFAQALGFVVIVPDVTLTPDAIAIPDRADALSGAEQVLIAQSDIVVCLDANVDSWGQSRTAAWAEKCGASVALLSTFDASTSASRILGLSSHRTAVLEGSTFTDAIHKFQAWLSGLVPTAQAHATDRIANDLELRPKLMAALTALNEIDPEAYRTKAVTAERARELVVHPCLLDGASRIELRALRQLLGNRANLLLGEEPVATDAQHAERSGFTGGEVSDNHHSGSLAGNPTAAPTGKASVNFTSRILRPSAAADLDTATDQYEWDDSEFRRLVLQYLDPVVPAGHHQKDPQHDVKGWAQLHRETVSDCRCTLCR